MLSIFVLNHHWAMQSLYNLGFGSKLDKLSAAVTTKHQRILASWVLTLILISKRDENKLKPTFSEPARSTRYSLPCIVLSVLLSVCLTCKRKTLWDRELCSFMFVTATLRLARPLLSSLNTSDIVCTSTSVTPCKQEGKYSFCVKFNVL